VYVLVVVENVVVEREAHTGDADNHDGDFRSAGPPGTAPETVGARDPARRSGTWHAAIDRRVTIVVKRSETEKAHAHSAASIRHLIA
jgi:hypothetical protein